MWCGKAEGERGGERLEKGEFEELIESLLDQDLHGGFIFIANELRDKLEEAKKEFEQLIIIRENKNPLLDSDEVLDWFVKYFGESEGEV